MRSNDRRKMSRVNELARKVALGEANADEQREFGLLCRKMETRDIDTRGAGISQSEHDRDFTRYLRTGVVSPSLRLAAEPAEYRIAGNSEGTQPGQVSGSGGTAGGYLVAQDFWRNLAVALKAYGGLSQHMKQLETPTGAVMPWPTVNPTSVIAANLAELTQLTPAQDYVFGQGVLNAWTYTSNPELVSLQLLNDSEFNVDEFMAARFGESIGRAVAAQAMTGSGASAPLGVITALGAGASVGTVGTGSISPVGNGWVQLATAASVKTFANPTGATELAQNVLSPASCYAMKAGVDPAYWPTSAWYFSPTQLNNMASIIDANGRPLIDFARGFQDGNAGTLLGHPVYAVPEIPALAASTTGGPVFGSMQHAMVMRTVQPGTSILRLDQRWADYLAVGFIAYMRFDIRSNDLRATVTCRAAAT
jgi:HK97 family phage major capsid protein